MTCFYAQTQFETSTNESFNELYNEISTLAQNRGKIAKLQQQETIKVSLSLSIALFLLESSW